MTHVSFYYSSRSQRGRHCLTILADTVRLSAKRSSAAVRLAACRSHRYSQTGRTVVRSHPTYPVVARSTREIVFSQYNPFCKIYFSCTDDVVATTPPPLPPTQHVSGLFRFQHPFNDCPRGRGQPNGRGAARMLKLCPQPTSRQRRDTSRLTVFTPRQVGFGKSQPR